MGCTIQRDGFGHCGPNQFHYRSLCAYSSERFGGGDAQCCGSPMGCGWWNISEQRGYCNRIIRRIAHDYVQCCKRLDNAGQPVDFGVGQSNDFCDSIVCSYTANWFLGGDAQCCGSPMGCGWWNISEQRGCCNGIIRGIAYDYVQCCKRLDNAGQPVGFGRIQSNDFRDSIVCGDTADRFAGSDA